MYLFFFLFIVKYSKLYMWKDNGLLEIIVFIRMRIVLGWMREGLLGELNFELDLKNDWVMC